MTDAEVQQQLEDLKEQTFKTEKEYTEFLETSGRTEEDILYQTKLDLLSNKLRENVRPTSPSPPPRPSRSTTPRTATSRRSASPRRATSS